MFGRPSLDLDRANFYTGHCRATYYELQAPTQLFNLHAYLDRHPGCAFPTSIGNRASLFGVDKGVTENLFKLSLCPLRRADTTNSNSQACIPLPQRALNFLL